MSATVGGDLDEVTFADLQTLTTALVTHSAGSRTADQLLADWRAIESVRNRLAALEHRCIIEAEQLGLPQAHAAVNTASFVRDLIHVDARDAAARVRVAHAAGPRQTLTGEHVEPEFPLVAAAQAFGSISPAHAQIVVRTIQQLPDAVLDEAAGLEAELVASAADFDPPALQKLATRRVAYLDQDGLLADVAYRQRHRDLRIHQRVDGSGTVAIDATAELMERLLTVLDPLAAPRPESDGQKDPRTAGQRRHDGLLDLLVLAQRAETLPDIAGVSTTVILTVSAEEWANGSGLARTGHGALIPTSEAARWAGDVDTITVVHDDSDAVVGHTDKRRIFSRNQRLALHARDKGCSFPGCDRPPQWTQAHHIVEHQSGGATSIDNGTLLCGHHLRNFQQLGWTCRMINNTPHWTAPTWLDPTRTPRHNHAHD